MKYINLLIALIFTLSVVTSCKKTDKVMTVKEFYQMELEVIGTNGKPEEIEKITKKYGFTAAEYTAFDDKVAKDPKLKEKLGEIRQGNKIPDEKK
jgi:hypothetical protein